MGLQISNGNNYSEMFQSQSQNSPQPKTIVPSKKITLQSSMIQRIHNVRPGCGSCGK